MGYAIQPRTEWLPTPDRAPQPRTGRSRLGPPRWSAYAALIGERGARVFERTELIAVRPALAPDQALAVIDTEWRGLYLAGDLVAAGSAVLVDFGKPYSELNAAREAADAVVAGPLLI